MDYQHICFLFTCSLVSARDVKYVLKGQEITLGPSSYRQPTRIFWTRHVYDIVSFDGTVESVAPTYENRILLDRNSAVLTIKQATYEDSGNYDQEVRVNKKLFHNAYKIEVIDKVSKPNISCEMIDTYQATLVCSAESKHSPLLKFKWRSDGNEQTGPNLTITLQKFLNHQVYICEVSNPLTIEMAAFTAKDCLSGKLSVAEKVVVTSMVALVFIGLCIFLVFYKKYRERRKRDQRRIEELREKEQRIIQEREIEQRIGEDHEKEQRRREEREREQHMKEECKRYQRIREAYHESFQKLNLMMELYNIKNPNELWFLDTYDQLTPYGITISACTDIFSDTIFWMEADNNHGDPAVFLNHFLDTVTRIGGCPQRLLVTPRRENEHITKAQEFLRRNRTDCYAGEDIVMEGFSLRRHRWIHTWEPWNLAFANLQELGKFKGNNLDKNLIEFCFLHIIQDWLKETVGDFNGILSDQNRARSQDDGPAEDKLQPVLPEDIDECRRRWSTPRGRYPCDETLFNRWELIRTENGWEAPVDNIEARKLYLHLREKIYEDVIETSHDEEVQVQLLAGLLE
ncbi:uncharacterized protein LOC133538336 isoform X5 [Nerophis ophidion]|uniref:uncharacterized protein LOC133538336 isoform X5 n=1 Tax=Nerophis ophidion TaxID=159077 RepID=UPI002AE010FB|nr:uncharacterized protein LOC133538336 isoform X5 [Nerophis ophidion]